MKLGKKTAFLALTIIMFLVLGYFIVATKNNFVSIGAGSVVGLPLLFGMTYDPGPRIGTRRRGGGLPKSIIKKYGISKKAWSVYRGAKRRMGKYDPRRPRRRSRAMGYGAVRPKPYRVDSRGGVALSGSRKLRYDPERRYPRLRRYGGRVGRGVEGLIDKYGAWMGGLVALVQGVYRGTQKYNEDWGKSGMNNYLTFTVGGDILDREGQKIGSRMPEIAHLFGIKGDYATAPDPISYLKYKFLGKDPYSDKMDVTKSTWGFPFWLGLGAWILGKVMPRVPYAKKLNRIWKPMAKAGKGVAIVSGIGALTLPNPHVSMGYQNLPPPPPPSNMNQFASVQTIGVRNPSPIHN